MSSLPTLLNMLITHPIRQRWLGLFCFRTTIDPNDKLFTLQDTYPDPTCGAIHVLSLYYYVASNPGPMRRNENQNLRIGSPKIYESFIEA